MLKLCPRYPQYTLKIGPRYDMIHPRCAHDTPKIRQKYTIYTPKRSFKRAPKIRSIYVKDMSEVYPSSAQDMSKIRQRYTKDTQKIRQIYTKDMSIICPRYAKDMPKICPRYTQDEPKIPPRYA